MVWIIYSYLGISCFFSCFKKKTLTVRDLASSDHRTLEQNLI